MDIQSIMRNLGGTYRNGKGQAPCPVCQTERRKDQNALSLSQVDDKILAYCFKSHCSFAEIVKAAEFTAQHGDTGREAGLVEHSKGTDYRAAQARKARELWTSSEPIKGSIADAYLQSRGITLPLPSTLRFVSNTYHGPSQSWCAAMVADVAPCGGVHRTFFTASGVRHTKSAKMMLGPCSGGAVLLSEGAGPLVVCEGIETGLSLVEMLDERAPSVWAALSTSGVKRLHLPDRPHTLIIASDGDEAGQQAATNLAKRAATQGWSVYMLPAPAGQDWNDILMAEGV